MTTVPPPVYRTVRPGTVAALVYAFTIVMLGTIPIRARGFRAGRGRHLRRARSLRVFAAAAVLGLIALVATAVVGSRERERVRAG
ncbi:MULTISPECIES: hypothetical protein [unclassified Nocardia]|uniref:hypothetical protein n=1 Tax=unclassified Nocardia TaxID=2637762 RepID=UPI001CE3CC57|nr:MULTISPECIES: hypothetical protein [unclassified Nocardia]